MPAPKKKIVTVELGKPQPKKNVIRYDAEDGDGALTTAYVSKAAATELGNPDSIKITIEAA